MAFERKNYRKVVDFGVDANNTVNLVDPIAADSRLVVARIRVVCVTPDRAKFYIFTIPSGGNESDETAIAYGLPIRKGIAYDEPQIVLNGGEGLAVGIQNIGGGSPKVIFTAFGELETAIGA